MIYFIIWNGGFSKKTHVVSSRDDGGQPVGLVKGLDQHLGRGLGGRVRVGGMQGVALLERVVVVAGVVLSIDFVCADVYKAFDLWHASLVRD